MAAKVTPRTVPYLDKYKLDKNQGQKSMHVRNSQIQQLGFSVRLSNTQHITRNIVSTNISQNSSRVAVFGQSPEGSKISRLTRQHIQSCSRMYMARSQKQPSLLLF